MKKNFMKAVLLALTVASMGMFNSCKDHDGCDDMRMDVENLKDKNADLQTVVATQTQQIQDLIDQLNAIKQCSCTLTPEQVQKMIDDAIAANVSSTEFTTTVNNIINQYGFQTAGQVQDAIATYMAANPAGLSEEQVKQLITAATESLATQEALDNAINTLTAAMNDAQTALNGKIDGVATDLANLTGVVNDLNNAASEAIATLGTVVTDLQTLKDKVGAAEGNIETLTGNLETLTGNVKDIQGQLEEIITAWGPKLTETIATANEALALAKQDSILILGLQNNYETLAAIVDSLANVEGVDLSGIENAIDSLAKEMEQFATKQALRDVLTAAEIMHEEAVAYTKRVEEWTAEELGKLGYKIDALGNVVDALGNKVGEIEVKVDSLGNEITVLNTTVGEIEVKVDSLSNEVEILGDKVGEIEIKLGDLEDKYNNLEATVNEIKDKVDEIYPMVLENRQYIKSIYNYLQKLITNIVIQAVNNPVFGSISTPWGIQSNILVGYYGETDNDVRFPTIRTANYIYKEQALTEKDAEMLGNSVENYKSFGQAILVDEEGNAGKVYLTVNPTNVDFTGTDFTLVNSLDEESPVKLGKLTKSDAKLTFGFTRAADNGFYEATATFTEDNIPTMDIDKAAIYENLKEVAKDVIDFRNGVNVKEAASRLYSVLMELNGNLDANGIKASWTNEDGTTQSVYSKYAIAATAIKPLSYEFLYDVNLGTTINNKLPNLPTISPISEAVLNNLIDLDKFNLQLNLDLSGLNFKIDPITPNIPAINIDFADIKLNGMGEIYAVVNIPQYDVVADGSGWKLVEKTTTKKDTVEVNTDAFKASIETEINNAFAKAEQEISAELKSQLETALSTQLNDAVNKIESSVNDLLQNQLANTINGSLNGAIKDVMNQVVSQVTAGASNYLDKANAFINKLNGWSGKFNNYMNAAESKLNNLNALLHVTMLYEGADGRLHQLSNSKSMPTVFNGEGVANLFATSYTGEIVAPAMKKFVAVTNVYKDGDSAQGGCTDCKAALDAVNSGEYFNTVTTGSRYGFAAENMKKGYTYEIFYSALDYFGKISARKFYVTVK